MRWLFGKTARNRSQTRRPARLAVERLEERTLLTTSLGAQAAGLGIRKAVSTPPAVASAAPAKPPARAAAPVRSASETLVRAAVDRIMSDAAHPDYAHEIH